MLAMVQWWHQKEFYSGIPPGNAGNARCNEMAPHCVVNTLLDAMTIFFYSNQPMPPLTIPIL